MLMRIVINCILTRSEQRVTSLRLIVVRNNLEQEGSEEFMLGSSKRGAAALLALAALGISHPASADNAVNVYSYRQPFLVKPLFDAFTKESGIKVNVVFARKGLVKRLQAEGRNSPADLIFTVDIGRLNDVVEADLVQPVKTQALAANVPTQFRHPDGLWYGLTGRARVIFASVDRVKQGEIASYEDLANPKWKGRICTRRGDHVYQVGLLASMIVHHGEAKAEQWLRGLKANLARKPQGNDRAQAKAIKEGVCDLALGNHYYMAKMLNNKKQRAWAEAVRIVFPNQTGRGTHMNISGMAMTKAAPNKANAIKLMEFLSGDDAQRIYAQQNFEYPAKPGVKWAPLILSWGEFRADVVNLDKVARNRKAALMMVNRVRYNN